MSSPAVAPAPSAPVERRRRRRAVNVGRAALAALRRVVAGGGEFITRLYVKAGQDDIFFLAGGIAFNVLFAAIPFLLLLIGVFAMLLPAMVADPQKTAVDYVVHILPATQAVVGATYRIVGAVMQGRRGFSAFAFIFFIWGSTRLFGSLRAVLKHIFDLPEDRGILEGAIFDIQMVLVAGTLFVANTGITIVLEAAQTFGTSWLGISNRPEVLQLQNMWGQILAFAFIFVMFLLIYRYLPRRRTSWRISTVAAVFTSVMWELLKGLFALYVVYATGYQRTYGALFAPVILVVWVYYSCVVFILGGEIAQVYDLLRLRRAQRELLE